MVEFKRGKGKVFTPPCVICGAPDTRFLCEVDDNNIWHCLECVSDFVWPMPDQQSLKVLYDRREWFEGGERGGYEHYDEQTESLPQYLEKAFGVIEAGGIPKSVLDIGCGYGTHLAVAAEKGWQCFGVEVSEHARKVAKERHGNSIYLVERIEELAPCQFDLILLLDVIEHLADPYPLFYTLFSKGAIGPQTRIVITTPNAKSWEAVTDPGKWAYRHPPSHLVYYSAQSLYTLLGRLNWNAVEIAGLHPLNDEPMKSNDEALALNEKFKEYAGLLCTATGSDFLGFMHERFVPGTWNKIAEYEHIPRYVMVQKLAEGLKVLDFGCGTGYGSAMLVKEAEFVVGVDISEDALQWARHHHRNQHLRFERRDDLGAGLSDNSFDLVTCFEMIEHVSQQAQALVIKNFRRILGTKGKLVISTPNPEVTENYGENPYHLHEMKEEEFVGLLKLHFKHVQILRQWILPSVVIADRALFAKEGKVRACSAGLNGTSCDLPAVAYVAICSDSQFADVEGICNFDSSFDYVAKFISDIKVSNHDRMDKYSCFKKNRSNERNLSEHIQTIVSLHEYIREKEATMHEAITGKESAMQSLEKKSTQQECNIANLRSALIASETALDAFRQSGLTDLLNILQNEAISLKKVFKAFKALVNILFPQAIFRKNGHAIVASGSVFVAYKVHAFFPSQKNRPKVIHALANFMTGGSSRLVVDLFERLGHCYEQEVVTSYKSDPPSYVGLPIHEFPNRISPDEILDYFEKVQPSLVHVHYWGDVDKSWYEQVFEAAERYGCKVVENINTPVDPFFADSIDRYVYVSDYVLHNFGKADKKSLTIYPGSNFDIFKRDRMSEVPNDCIGMVYRLEPDKLNEQAIDAFIEVSRRRPATKVLIVGGGTFLEPYKEAARAAGLFDSFNFTGYVSYDELPALYAQMSLFVAPVWKESFGQVSAFAMSMGIPVVGYDIGALSEITADRALLAPPGDSYRLADIIIDLLEDRERRLAIGVRNRDRAKEYFTVESMIEGYEALYGELMGEGQ